MNGVSPCFQHVVIVVRLQKCGMALFKMIDHVAAGYTEIGEDTYFNCCIGDNKTVWITGIMKLRKTSHSETSHLYWFISFKVCNQMPLHTNALLKRGWGYINRKLIFF